MEISGFRSLADLGMDDHLFFQQWPADSFDELISSEIASSFWEDFHHYSCNSQQQVLDFKRAAPESSQVGDNMPLKRLKTTTTTWNSCEPESLSPPNSSCDSPTMGLVKPKEEACYSSKTLMLASEPIASQSSSVNQNYELKPCQRINRITTNTKLAQAHDHTLAERKRREKLSQRFIALSTLVPGLKKMDKASVLEDAIKYMKQLQDKVKTLEKQTKKTAMESVVFVKKYEVHGDGDKSSSNESFSSVPIITESLPELEARFCNKDVLISIHCEKRKGVLEKIVAEIEKFHLSVVNSSVMTYGDSALNITLIAEKNEELTMSMKELVKNLRGVLKIFM